MLRHWGGSRWLVHIKVFAWARASSIQVWTNKLSCGNAFGGKTALTPIFLDDATLACQPQRRGLIEFVPSVFMARRAVAAKAAGNEAIGYFFELLPIFGCTIFNKLRLVLLNSGKTSAHGSR